MEEIEKCSFCNKNEAKEPHTCPYKQEINNNDSECNCCSDFTHECCIDI